MNWHVIQSFSIKLEHNNWKWKYFHCPTIWSEGKDWQVRPWSPSVIERKDEHQKMFRPTHNTNTRYEDCHWGVIELFNLTSSAPLSLSVMFVYTCIHEQSSIVRSMSQWVNETGLYGFTETNVSSTGQAWVCIRSSTYVMAVSLVFCGMPNSGNRCVSGSFG